MLVEPLYTCPDKVSKGELELLLVVFALKLAMTAQPSLCPEGNVAVNDGLYALPLAPKRYTPMTVSLVAEPPVAGVVIIPVKLVGVPAVVSPFALHPQPATMTPPQVGVIEPVVKGEAAL
jgi:hypothetical protein